MRKSSAVAVTVAAVLVCGSAAWAQRPERGAEGHQGGMPRMMGVRNDWFIRWLTSDLKAAEALGLSDEQAQSLKDLAEKSRAERDELVGKTKEAVDRQTKRMGEDAPDEEALMKGVEEIGELGIEISKIETRAFLAARKILTPEQMQKAQQMGRERVRDRMQQTGVRVRTDAAKRPPRGEGGEAPASEPPPAEPAP